MGTDTFPNVKKINNLVHPNIFSRTRVAQDPTPSTVSLNKEKCHS